MFSAEQSSRKLSWKKLAILALKIAIVFFAVRYLFVSDRLELSQLSVREDGFGWIVFAACLCVLLTAVSQLRYWVLLRAGEVEVSLMTVLRIGFVSWLCNATFLGGFGVLSGDAVKIGLLLRVSDRKAAILSSTVLDRILGFLALLLLAVFALGSIEESQLAGGVASSVSLYGVVFATVGYAAVLSFLLFLKGWKWMIAAWIISAPVMYFVFNSSGVGVYRLLGVTFAPVIAAIVLSLFLTGGVIYRVIERIPVIGDRYAQLVLVLTGFRKKGGALLMGFGLSLLVQFLAIVVVYVVGRGISVPYSPEFGQVWATAPPVFALNVLPLPANGLGIGEAAFDAFLRVFMNDSGEAITGGAAIYLGFRLLMTITALSGIPFLLISGGDLRKAVREQAKQ